MPFTNYRSQKAQYRQAERIIAKFTCNLAGAAGTFVRASGSNQVSNNKVTIGPVGTPGASQFVVSMPKARLITLVSAIHYPAAASATVTEQRELFPLTDLPVAVGALNTWTFLMLSNVGVAGLPVLNCGLSFIWEIAQ